jgi:hypothetical protein
MDLIFERCVTFENGMMLAVTCEWAVVLARWILVQLGAC